MESSRRRFIKLAGITALGLSAQPVIKAVAAAPSSQGYEMTKRAEALTASSGAW
jgi:hypothetical protein